jgi:hypothetical protein
VDVEGVRRCLIALASVTRRPDAARDAARAALARPAAPVASAAARLEIDAAGVLLRVGEATLAISALQRALSRLDDRLHSALVREACRLGRTVSDDPRFATRLKRVGG